jgi:succinate dehydrogenase / fumarate reductase cytochrome b subunit
VTGITLAANPGFVRSTIGRKVVMAVTGVILFGFVLAHMAGNLQVYLGPAAFNHYAEFLREVLHGTGLWIARAVLLAAAVLHVWAATSLTLQSRAARPVAYRQWTARESTYASRTMRWSGVIVLVFVIYHLLHFTFGTVHPDYVPGDVYHNFVAGFEVPVVSAFYILANVLLGFHLRHGVWSMLQTLGLSHPRYKRVAVLTAAAFAIIVTVGNLSFPIAVLAGWIQ